MQIAFLGIEDWEKEEIKKQLKSHKLYFLKTMPSKADLKEISNVNVLVSFIYSQIDKTIIDSLPNLKFIATMSTGYDHIDLTYCQNKCIKVSNVPTYGENTVAEHTLGLILTLSRKLFQSVVRTHIEHNFETDSKLRGFDLKGKTLGIIGGGHIGLHVARMARGFEMNVLVSDLHPQISIAKKLGFKYTNLKNLLKKSDIITLHVPYNKSTHHMINESSIKQMKEGIYLINTSRGAVIDTTALVKALKSKKIAACALDVLEEEEDIKEEFQLLKPEFKQQSKEQLTTILEDHVLMSLDNVVITPHNAFNSKEALLRILNTTIEN